MIKHPQPERSYFPISPRRRLLLLAVVTAICAIPVAFIIGSAFSGDGALAAVGFVLFLVTAPFSVLLLVAVYNTRLSINERGLEARGTVGMSSVSVSWDDIQQIRLQPGSEGVILKAPLQGRASKLMKLCAGASYRGVSVYSPEVQQFVAERRYIPLEAFTWWFQKGDLTSRIEQYCPRVLADEN